MEQDAQIELRLLGAPAWRACGGEGSGAWQALSRKDAAVLALLAVERTQTRERLWSWLWPDTPPVQAQANLRQRAHRLRRAAGAPMLLLGELVHLAPGLRHDLSDWGRSEQRPLGPFEYDDSEALTDWVRRWRERWEQARQGHLAAAADGHALRGELGDALRLAEELVRMSPLREPAWRRLMRLHEQGGDRAAALAAYERCEALLREELGTRPDAETLALRAQIVRSLPGEGDPAALAPRPLARLQLPTALIRPPVLIGREGAWRAMAAAWESGQPFVLSSPAGQGKTRLLQDFVAERRGVLWVSARPGDAAAPYALAARWLLPLARRQEAALSAFERRELARLLPELGEPPRSAGHQGVLWRAVESVLERALAQDLRVLVLDDLHAADAASLELLRWLCASESLKALRFALATRSDEAEACPVLRDWLGESHRPVTVALGPWSLQEVQALLHALAFPDSERLGAQLHRHAGGHPFFTLETLKELALQQRRPEPDQALPVPVTVQALIDRRLARLSHAAHDLMRVSAVAGPRGDAALAARVLGGDALSWAGSFAELEAADVLREGGFSHDLMREAALRALPMAVARALHATVAQALQELGGESHARMAWHWEAAGRWAEAGRAWHDAGLAARRAGRLAEQHGLLQRAADAFARAGDAAARFDALYAGIDSVLIRSGGQALFDEVGRIAPLAATPLQRLLVPIGRADALLNLQRFPEALAETEVLMAGAEQLGEWRVDAMCLHGQALSQSGRLDEALQVLREARALAAAAGDDLRSLHVASAMAFACVAASRQGEAVEAQREALERAVRAGDAAEVALAQGNLATAYLTCGLPREGHAMALAARASHAEMGSGDGVHAAINLVALGSGALWLGRLDEADEVLRRAQALLGERAGGAAHAKVRTVAACLALARGDRSQALRLLQQFLPDTPLPLRLVGELVRLRAALGFDDAQAAAVRQQVERLLAEQPALARHPAVLVEWGRHLERDQALPLLAEVEQAQQAMGAVGVARSLRYLRVLRLAQCDVDEAAALAPALISELPQGCHASLDLEQALAELRALSAAAQTSASARPPA